VGEKGFVSVGNSPTLVVRAEFDQLESGRSLSPIGLAFGVQLGFLPVGPIAPGMG
jgi:hypothetical protein